MTDFDRQLNIKLHEYKMDSEMSTYEIADDAGIGRDTLYKFLAGKRSMNGENTQRLIKYLDLDIDLEFKS